MMNLHEAQELVSDGRLHGPPELRFSGVSTDSRTTVPGDLFVALSGERFDGHEFIDAAQARGAVAVLAERATHNPIAAIRVADTRRALGELARGWRLRFSLPLILVTGSNGKTTTKEMIAAILASAFGPEHRLATRGNLNNDIGLPLTLFGLRSSHRAAVIELGMNHPRETEWLAGVACPTITVITNAQREHQEFMQNVEAVAHEHALAISALGPKGTAVFPADDTHAEVWRSAAQHAHTLEFALADPKSAKAAPVSAVAHLEPFATVVHIETPAGPITARLMAAGLHNVRNAAAAVAASLCAGVEVAHIHDGLEEFVPAPGRMQRKQGAHGGMLIDDSYNANPDSVRAAIEVLAASPAPRLLILGDMGEVGEHGANFHAEIGQFAASSAIDMLFASGDLMRTACKSFGQTARHFGSLDELNGAARAWLFEHDGASVLVKGSRFMGMERVVAALENRELGGTSQSSPGVH